MTKVRETAFIPAFLGLCATAFILIMTATAAHAQDSSDGEAPRANIIHKKKKAKKATKNKK